jgi:neutral ceramidase
MTLLLLLLLQGEWKAGVSAVKITPEQPVHLGGYASRTTPFTGVAADLWAKALALEDETGAKAVLVTTDLLGLPADVAEPVAAEIRERSGVPRERILLSASHTHTGPSLAPRDGRPENVEYTKVLREKLVRVAVEALGRLAPATLSWGQGISNIPMNRREFTSRGVILGINARGPVDRSVPVLRVDGGAKAILFQCSCHCTTCTGEVYDVNGDYAGFAQEAVEKALPGVQAMFMAGCGGDANPFPRGTVDLARRHGAELGEEVVRVASGKLAPVRGPLGAAFGHAELPFRPAPSLEELRELARTGPGHQRGVFAAQAKLLEKVGRLPSSYPAPAAVWQFGEDLTLVALSGEVVVDYVFRLEKALGPMKLWISAYHHDVFGYLPSARVLEEGGYETRGTYAGAPGIFAPAVEDVLAGKILELAARAGRK